MSFGRKNMERWMKKRGNVKEKKMERRMKEKGKI
jgi:hypothetical protein